MSLCAVSSVRLFGIRCGYMCFGAEQDQLLWDCVLVKHLAAFLPLLRAQASCTC
jgi:hypothetical protein